MLRCNMRDETAPAAAVSTAAMISAALLLVLAHTSARVEQVCPIDGTKFSAVVDMSGTSFGKQLDLRPLGPTAKKDTAPHPIGR